MNEIDCYAAWPGLFALREPESQVARPDWDVRESKRSAASTNLVCQSQRVILQTGTTPF
jgi:hypothetical protein